MKLTRVGDESLLAAADRDILNKTFRENNLHITVSEEFYGNVGVRKSTFRSALQMCTIANFVGEEVVAEAISLGYVLPENVLRIQGIPYAQYAKILN